ncbi:AraC family transcriptional regulator [Lederbergia sp. NSJ-179]|uniref:helix-turn-helix domain-containing protein n=1 Tax=Lederbergia sp. NSJ-179 TaxID=2931402 RepID=UPI001FD36CE2|nr:helix-turn-helix domain-containing protein [Lederbergia sp. NSJ-179]MCJ7840250.1 AraC family transcriptional regulator [Lederbergia sp. NSJ-179]
MPNFFHKWFRFNLLKNQTSLLLFLTIAIFLIILIVSITSYNTSKAVLQEQLNEPQQQMLQISMNFIDEAINESNRIATEVALDDHVYRFLTSDDPNAYNNIKEIYRLLTSFVTNSPVIKSIYVYDINKGSFVTIPHGYSATKVTFVDSQWTDVAEELQDKMMIVKKREVPEGARSSGSEITLFRKILIQGESKGLVAVNLNEKELFRKINPPKLTNIDSTRFIIDEQNEILYSVSNHSFDQEAVEAGIANLKKERLGDVRYEGETLLASQVQSPVTGWQYISLVTQESILAKSKRVGHIVFFVSLVALFIGLMVIVYMNIKVFRPIFRLKQLFIMKEQDISKQGLNELENIAGQLIHDHAHLAQTLDTIKAEASSKFILDIYQGDIKSRREIQEKWNDYFRDWNNKSLVVAILSIDNFSAWSHTFPSMDHSLLKFALKNIISEVLTEHAYNECVDFGQDKLAVLLQYDGKTEPLTHKFMKALSSSERLLGFSASVGISHPKQTVGEIKEAVFEAELALGYRLYKGYGSVIPINKCHVDTPHIPTKMDQRLKQLAESIIGGDDTQGIKLVEEIIQEIRDQQTLPTIALSKIHSMIDVIWSHTHDKFQGHAEENELKTGIISIYLDDIEVLLKDGVIHESEKWKKQAKNKESILCEKMITYMKDHLNEAIGIAEIADSIGISVSLASQIFKEKTDDTIYGYLTKLRIEKAEELLLHTDKKVATIAFEVGYQHENSFIRVFRKYKNVTPGKYREMLRNKKRSLAE